MRKQVIMALAALSVILLVVSGCYEVQQMGVTNLDSLHLSDSGGTATPVLRVNQDGAGKVVEFLDASTPVWSVNDGGAVEQTGGTTYGGTLDMNGNKIDLDADADTSLTADTDDQVDWEIGGADVMTWMDFGASTITTDTTRHLVEILDSTNVMTGGTNTLSALNIDLGIGNSTAGTNSVYGILIDAISQDAQNTETAIEIGAGWDVGIDMNGNSLVLDSASNYPMGYATSGWEMVAGTASATATTVVATTITTPTYALCTITDGLTDNEEQKCSTTLSGANLTINVYKEDGSAADSAVNVDYLVIGQP